MTGIEKIAKEREKVLKIRPILSDVINNPNYELAKIASILVVVTPDDTRDGAMLHTDVEEFVAGMEIDWDLSLLHDIFDRDYEERLIIAGQLIAAELDRLEDLKELQK